jgi:hypothetical protein
MRPPNPQELAATTILMIKIEETVAKVRQDRLIDDEADLSLPHWAGVIPIQSS